MELESPNHVSLAPTETKTTDLSRSNTFNSSLFIFLAGHFLLITFLNHEDTNTPISNLKSPTAPPPPKVTRTYQKTQPRLRFPLRPDPAWNEQPRPDQPS